MSDLKQARSSLPQENIQEILDAGFSDKHETLSGMNQYCTPLPFAMECQQHLVKSGLRQPATILDPQCADGNLVRCISGPGYLTLRFGIDIDNRIPDSAGVNLITGNCQKVFEAIADLCPDLRIVCINANPPFGKQWKTADGGKIDSTLSTWRFATKHGNYGFFIANAATIEKLALNTSPLVFDYWKRPASEIWPNMKESLTIGVLFWKRPDEERTSYTPSYEVRKLWGNLNKIIEEERNARPPFNIYLSEAGILKTYLSVRSEVKLKISREQILRLHKINDCHPLTLTTEKESRMLMKELVAAGIYTIQPEALAAIEKALQDVNALAAPIMPVTDFEGVAYADEEEALTCLADYNDGKMRFTGGKTYKLSTGTYKFTQQYKRNKVHYNERTMETYTQEHDCVLSGQDRYIQVLDDSGKRIRFMDRPNVPGQEFEEKMLWQIFRKPVVNTIAETCREHIDTNVAVLKSCEMMAGYKYYPGQLHYLSRVAVKDSALIAAETGCGKTLMAISLLAMKCPDRALIIAPQGTMRSSEVEVDDEESEEFQASQWIRELNKFAPYLQVWEIFSYEDYERICSLNNGELPPGVYVSYPQAMFQNGAKEKVPETWNDEKLNQWAGAMGLATLPKWEEEGEVNTRHWCESVGTEKNGVRCIMEPCLATQIGHLFDCVMLDEAHLVCNLSANVTQMLIRLQPKYRYALTATPIPNVITNLFSLMGWLAVPGWYRGGTRNAAFPYAREDVGRFEATFRSEERDVTQEEENRRKDPRWSGKCTKASPIISSPARLLKLLKPTLAFISKTDCSPGYIKPKVIDVRVPMGKEQVKLYGHFLNRANIQAKHPLVRARKQTAYLRNICADPAGFTHGGPKVSSNMNPKVIAILELTRDILGRGEQVVIINSRVGLTNTLQHKLSDAGVAIARIDSTMSPEQHSQQANLFKSGRARVLLMGIKCAAAYSFDAAENLIIGSLEYSYGPFCQAIGRIDRVTNKMIKNIYCILHKHSIEEIMFDTVSVKGDAATICLKGQRVPRDFKPVDASEVLAIARDRFDVSGATPESECEAKWPKLCDAIRGSLDKLTP